MTVRMAYIPGGVCRCWASALREFRRQYPTGQIGHLAQKASGAWYTAVTL